LPILQISPINFYFLAIFVYYCYICLEKSYTFTETKHKADIMEYYNKVIESVGVRFNKGNNYKEERPVSISDYTELENTLILLHQASWSFVAVQDAVIEGELLLITDGRSCKISFGTVSKRNETNNENFIENKKKYLQTVSFKDIKNTEEDCVTILTFEAKVFDVVNFFHSLGLPPFIIRFNDRIASIVED